jgi:hypothetical protein
MIKNIARLRFNSPEPSQIRSNALGGMFKNGDEGARLTFDDATGVVYINKDGVVRAIHISACAWIELADRYPVATISPEAIAASRTPKT